MAKRLNGFFSHTVWDQQRSLTKKQ